MDLNTQKAIQYNKDQIARATNVLREAQREINNATRNLALLKTYGDVLIPYLDEAIKGTQVSHYDVKIQKSYYDVTFYVPATKIYTRIAADFSDDYSKLLGLKLALSYTWCPIKQDQPSGVYETTTRYEEIPKAEHLIERLGEICWMSEDEKTVHEDEKPVETTDVAANKEQEEKSEAAEKPTEKDENDDEEDIPIMAEKYTDIPEKFRNPRPFGNIEASKE